MINENNELNKENDEAKIENIKEDREKNDKLKELNGTAEILYSNSQNNTNIFGLIATLNNTTIPTIIGNIVLGFDKISTYLQNAVLPVVKWIQSIDNKQMVTFFENLYKLLSDAGITDNQYKNYLKTMCECSWFPYACSDADIKLMNEINDIADTSRGKSKRRTSRVDKVVYSFYTKPEINKIKRAWHKSELEYHIKKMLCQAINAHLRGEYALTITCLAPMWEFFIREKIEDKKRTADEYKNDVKKLFIENGFEEEYGDFYTKSIIEKCYGPDETVEGVPNRHGIAHCWYKKYPNKKTSLNAILVTDFIMRLKSSKTNGGN